MTARLGDGPFASRTPSSNETRCREGPNCCTKFLEQRAKAGPASRARAVAIRAVRENRRVMEEPRANAGGRTFGPKREMCQSGTPFRPPLTLQRKVTRTKQEPLILNR